MQDATGLQILDWAVLLIYFFVVVGLGFFFRKNQSLSDYFLAGRSVHWLVIGVSIVATLFSAVSFVALPGEAYENGLSMYPRSPMAILAAPIVILLFLPFYHRIQIYTVFEYLEQRFTLSVRLIGSALFLLVRSAYIAVVFYASAKALQPLLHLSIPAIIVIVGIIATLYTVMGGMKAVIWTDFIQFIILFGGILYVLVQLILSADGHVVEIYQYAAAHDHGFGLWATKEFYSFSLHERVTLWSILAYVIVWNSYTYGVDQLTVQRYLSTKDLKSSVKATVFQFLLLAPFAAAFWFIGTALFYHYGHNPELLPANGLDSDKVLSYYIIQEFPPGLVGLIFGAILAAVMSTVDSGINSLSTATIVDFFKRLSQTSRTDGEYLKLSRQCTFFWGGFSILGACGIALASEKANAAIIEVTAIWGNLNAVLLGVFLLGMLTKRCNAASIYFAIGIGAFTTLYVSTVYYFWAPEAERVSFLWIGAIILAATLLSGYLSSFLTGGGKKAGRRSSAGGG